MRTRTSTLWLLLAFALGACSSSNAATGAGGAGGETTQLKPDLPDAAAPACQPSDAAACVGTCTASQCCPSLDGATPLAALQSLKSALAAEATSRLPRWFGLGFGVSLGRDGRPSGGAGSWKTGLCVDSSGVSLAVATTGSWVARTCAVACEALGDDVPLPTIDAPAAITAAFPSDPTGTLYTLTINTTVQGRVWLVERQPDGAAVRVDLDTGAVK